MLLLSPFEAAEFGRSAFWATLSASNILFWKTTGYFDLRSEFNPLLMTWSLGVEEQFYAVIPLLMVLLTHIRRAWILPAILISCALSFAFAVGELGVHPTMVFYMLPARAWEMGIGVALAVAEREGRTGLLARFSQVVSGAGLVAILAPMFLLTVGTPFPGLAALPSVLGTALLLAAPNGWISKRLLSLSPLVFIGRISYSLYLWHWPLLALARVVCGGKLSPLSTALMIAAALGAAILSYYFVEQPFRRSAVLPAQLLLRYAEVSVLVLVVCAALWLTHGVPQRNPALARIETSGATLVDDPCLAAYGSSKPNLSGRCYPTGSGKPAIALWGDSHSAALAPGLRAAAMTQGYEFDQLSKASCLPLTGATRHLDEHPMLAAECLQFNHKALDLLAGFWSAPMHQTLKDGWLTSDLAHQRQIPSIEVSNGLFEQGLTASAQALLDAGKDVVVFDDVPAFDVDPLWRVRTTHMALRRDLTGWLGLNGSNDPGYALPSDGALSEQATSILRQTVARLPAVAFIDLKTELCRTPNECAYRLQDNLLYIDPQHLSAAGAMYALRDFRLPAPPSAVQRASRDVNSRLTGSSPVALQK